MIFRSIALAAMAMTMSACTQAAKATFQVQVINKTPGPISVALVKDAPLGHRPAVEEGWAAPEDVALGAPQLSERHWGRLVQPGQAILIGPLTGEFPRGIYAALRVYEGNHTIGELVAFNQEDPDRLDVILEQGLSAFIIERKDRRLQAVPTQPIGPPPATRPTSQP